VEHIYRGILFIFDRHHLEHAGFICVKAHSCVVVGGSRSNGDRNVSIFPILILLSRFYINLKVNVDVMFCLIHLHLLQGDAHTRFPGLRTPSRIPQSPSRVPRGRPSSDCMFKSFLMLNAKHLINMLL
jgi:transcription elongation factor SPT5